MSGRRAASGLTVAVHQGDDEDGDVVSGAQTLVCDPPAAVPQHAARSHHQVLGRHRVPGQREGGASCLSTFSKKSCEKLDEIEIN